MKLFTIARAWIGGRGAVGAAIVAGAVLAAAPAAAVNEIRIVAPWDTTGARYVDRTVALSGTTSLEIFAEADTFVNGLQVTILYDATRLAVLALTPDTTTFGDTLERRISGGATASESIQYAVLTNAESVGAGTYRIATITLSCSAAGTSFLTFDSSYTTFRVTALAGVPDGGRDVLAQTDSGVISSVDTALANAWYVNDTSTTGDSFTTRIGADTHSGLAPDEPFLRAESAARVLTAGDTIFIDRGTFTPAETVTIGASSVSVIGVDSSATVLDFNDTTQGGHRALHASNVQRVAIRDLRLTRGRDGVRFVDVDTSTVERVRVDGHGRHGIHLTAGSDANVLRSNGADGNAGHGIVLDASRLNLVETNVATSNALHGLHLAAGADTNTLRSNRAVSNVQAGIGIDSSRGNNVHQNEVRGNDTGVRLIGTAPGNIVSKNVLWPNDILAIWNEGGGALTIVRNWYGTTDSAVVGARVADTANAYTPFRLGPVDTTAGADTVAPRAPDTVAASNVADTVNRISWAATTANEEASPFAVNLAGYRVYRSTTPTASLWTLRATASPSTTMVDDSGLGAGETWYYRVTAFDNAAIENEAFFSDSIAVAATPPPPETVPPDTFFLVSPAQGEETGAVPIRFRWTDATDSSPPVTYRIRIATSAAFSPLLVDSDVGANTQAAVPQLAGTETYFWRVIATDAVGNTRVSTPNDSSFLYDTTPPVAAVLIAPPDGHETTATTIRFAWAVATDSHSGLASHRLQVSTSASFAAPVVDTMLAPADTTEVVALAASESYFWRVLATDDAGNTAASAVQTLLVDTTPPAAFGLLSPIAGANTTAVTVFLDWQDAADTGSGLASYRVQIATNAGFAPLVRDGTQGPVSETYVALAVDTYFWRAIAEDDAGNTRAASNAPETFVVLAPDSTPPAPFLLLRPAQGTETSVTPVRFEWTASNDTQSPPVTYVLRRSTQASFATFIDSSAGTDTFGVVALAGTETYFWRVIASDAAGNTTTAGDSSLLLDTTPPAAFALETPVAGAPVGSPATLRWFASADTLSGLGGYRVEVSTAAGFTLLAVDSTVAAPNTSVVVALAPETWLWRVTAFDDAGNTTPSAVDSFVIPGVSDTTPPAAFSLLAPADGLVDSNVVQAFSWGASSDTGSGLLRYEFWISTSPTFAPLHPLSGSVAPSAFPNTTVILPPNDTYFWRVIAVDNAGNTTVSTPSSRRIVIDTAAPSVFASVDPTGGETVVSPVRLVWTASADGVSGLASYRVQVSTQSAFGSPAVDTTTAANDTDVIVSLGFDTWFWRVIAVDNAGNTRAMMPAFDSFLVRGESNPPTVLSATAGPSSVTNAGSDTVLFSVSAVDTQSGVASVVIDLGLLGGPSAQPLSDTDGDGTWTLVYTVPDSAVGGAWNLPVTVTDNAGNVATTTIAVTVTDVTPASPAEAEMISPDAFETVEAGTNRWLSILIGPDTTLTRVVFEVKPDSGAAWTIVGEDTEGPTFGARWMLDTVAAGTWFLKATGYIGGTADTSPRVVQVTVAAPGDPAVVIREFASGADFVTTHRVGAGDSALVAMWNGTMIDVPVGAFSQAATWRSVILAPSSLTAAESQAIRTEGLADVGLYRDFQVDGVTRPVFGAGGVTVVVPYADSDTLDDMMGATSIREDQLRLYFFDESLGRWMLVPNQVRRWDVNVIAATVTHFTRFGIFAETFTASVNDVRVYPNPYMPNDGDDNTGRPWASGDPSSGIIFDRLPPNSVIEIFDIVGRRVSTIQVGNPGGTSVRVNWDARNDSGRDVASGVYVALIRGGGGVVTRKIMVIR